MHATATTRMNEGKSTAPRSPTIGPGMPDHQHVPDPETIPFIDTRMVHPSIKSSVAHAGCSGLRHLFAKSDQDVLQHGGTIKPLPSEKCAADKGPFRGLIHGHTV